MFPLIFSYWTIYIGFLLSAAQIIELSVVSLSAWVQEYSAAFIYLWRISINIFYIFTVYNFIYLLAICTSLYEEPLATHSHQCPSSIVFNIYSIIFFNWICHTSTSNQLPLKHPHADNSLFLYKISLCFIQSVYFQIVFTDLIWLKGCIITFIYNNT